MKTYIYNQNGEIEGNIELPKSMFGLKPNHNLIMQAYYVAQSNKKNKWAHTKDRSERRGGGRKPWKQKGTSNARAGSRRSPIWHKGGIVFGPRKEKNFTKKINKKMKSLAFLQVLSSKAKDKELKVVKSIKAEKTKEMHNILKKLGIEQSAVVIGTNRATNKSLRNIPKIRYTNAQDLNLLDLLNHKHLIITQKSLIQLTNRFNKINATN